MTNKAEVQNISRIVGYKIIKGDFTQPMNWGWPLQHPVKFIHNFHATVTTTIFFPYDWPKINVIRLKIYIDTYIDAAKRDLEALRDYKTLSEVCGVKYFIRVLNRSMYAFDYEVQIIYKGELITLPSINSLKPTL